MQIDWTIRRLRWAKSDIEALNLNYPFKGSLKITLRALVNILFFFQLGLLNCGLLDCFSYLNNPIGIFELWIVEYLVKKYYTWFEEFGVVERVNAILLYFIVRELLSPLFFISKLFNIFCKFNLIFKFKSVLTYFKKKENEY